MDSAILMFVTAAFTLLGAVGLLRPQRIAGYFGNTLTNTDQRNELRAVYGGLPLAIALLGILTVSGNSPLDTQSMLFVASILLFGMAGGRVVSLCIERPTRRSYLFLLFELVLGGVALYGFIN